MPKNLHSSKNKGKYKRYKDQARKVKNKISKLKRHIKRQPKDKVAQQALMNI